MHFIFIFLLHLLLFLLKIAAFLHYISCCPALIISLPSTVLASEHRSRASLILSKLEVVVDAHVHSDGLYIQVISADESKGPVLLLQLPNEVLQHGSNSHASCVFRHNVLYEVRQKSLTHDRSDIHHDPVLHHYHSSHHPAFWSIE